MNQIDYRLVTNPEVFHEIEDYMLSNNDAKKEFGIGFAIRHPIAFYVDNEEENVGELISSAMVFYDKPIIRVGEIAAYGKIVNSKSIYDVLSFMTSEQPNENNKLRLELYSSFVFIDPERVWAKHMKTLEELFKYIGDLVKLPKSFYFYFIYSSSFHIDQLIGVIENSENGECDRKYLNLDDIDNIKLISLEPSFLSICYNRIKNFFLSSTSQRNRNQYKALRSEGKNT